MILVYAFSLWKVVRNKYIFLSYNNSNVRIIDDQLYDIVFSAKSELT